jgi:predicted ArsR family transcriptional regulator
MSNTDPSPFKKPNTRERILAHLHEHRTATVPALSRAWGLTRADIRYHLNQLINEGFVERVPRSEKIAAGRGRPEQVYRLSVSALPANLTRLCSALLSMINNMQPSEMKPGSDKPTEIRTRQPGVIGSDGEMQTASSSEDLREQQKDKSNYSWMGLLANILSAGFEPEGSGARRWNQVVNHLNQHNYRARWEAHATGPRILLRNCPYAALLTQHPEICQMDRFFLEKLLQIPLSHTARINPATGAPPACVFVQSNRQETSEC